PLRQFRRVVLPQPEGPMMATISPRWIVRLTPRRARTSTLPVSYVLTTSVAWMIGLAPADAGAVSSARVRSTVMNLAPGQSLGLWRGGAKRPAIRVPLYRPPERGAKRRRRRHPGPTR